MQLFARSESGDLVQASHASRQVDYFCLECSGKVRIRSGPHRRAHFYHLHPSELCRQSGKSLVHLQVQCSIRDMLPAGEVLLEHPFPSIRRIADVVWEPQRLVFEVQCSPISVEELLARNRDYASEGYQVVWILHSKRYGKPLLSAIEPVLRSHPHYFTNIDADGDGEIYDLFWLEERARRAHCSDPYPISIECPVRTAEVVLPEQPFLLARERLRDWPVFFGGDLVDAYLHGELEDKLTEFHSWELAARQTVAHAPRRRIWRRLTHGYTVVFRLLLEKACR